MNKYQVHILPNGGELSTADVEAESFSIRDGNLVFFVQKDALYIEAAVFAMGTWKSVRLSNETLSNLKQENEKGMDFSTKQIINLNREKEQLLEISVQDLQKIKALNKEIKELKEKISKYEMNLEFDKHFGRAASRTSGFVGSAKIDADAIQTYEHRARKAITLEDLSMRIDKLIEIANKNNQS